jgi:hypothetical protein
MLWSSSLSNFLHDQSSSLLGPNILLNSLFSKTLNRCASLSQTRLRKFISVKSRKFLGLVNKYQLLNAGRVLCCYVRLLRIWNIPGLILDRDTWYPEVFRIFFSTSKRIPAGTEHRFIPYPFHFTGCNDPRISLLQLIQNR